MDKCKICISFVSLLYSIKECELTIDRVVYKFSNFVPSRITYLALPRDLNFSILFKNRFERKIFRLYSQYFYTCLCFASDHNLFESTLYPLAMYRNKFKDITSHTVQINRIKFMSLG